MLVGLGYKGVMFMKVTNLTIGDIAGFETFSTGLGVGANITWFVIVLIISLIVAFVIFFC